jgi:hypothetical protein
MDKHVEAALLRVDEMKTRANAASYLETITPQHRPNIEVLAEQAFPTRGKGRSAAVFKDLMAREWLAQGELFELVASDNGFSRIRSVLSTETRQILALTINGSILGLQESAPQGPREVFYSRIGIRESANDLPPKFNGYLSGAIMVNSKANIHSRSPHTPGIKSSPIMLLAVGKEDNPRTALDNTLRNMTWAVTNLRTRL